jgi:predicted esterase
MKLSKLTGNFTFACIGVLCIFGLWSREEPDIIYVGEYISFTQMARLPLRNLPKEEAWQRAASHVVEISIPRNGQESDQPALWFDSGSDRQKPLLLVLHSWSEDYQQHFGIPYAVFAKKNDWIFIHPDFQGEFDNYEATASEKAVQDVLLALDYATTHASVDESRIYLAGFSGGAMMSLIMAGRYPEKFTAVLAWVPVYDLNDWYDYLIPTPFSYTDDYQKDIEASCGGDPRTDERSREECRTRSPSTYLRNARGKEIRVFISAGVEDPFVPPSHAVRAFNDLARDKDKISEDDYRYIDEHKSLPEGLKGYEEEHPFFEEAGLPVIFKRESGNVTIFLFDGGHDIVYNKGMKWLSEQKR